MKIQLVQEQARNKRKTRSPRIDTASLFYPFAITPFAFHPVLPGETLKNLWYNLNYISDPLKSRSQIGWIDTLFFYIKHSQLPAKDALIAMHVDGTDLPNSGSTARLASIDRTTFSAVGAVPYEKMCLDLVVQHYFRDDEEALTPASGLIGGRYPAQIQRDGWWQSLQLSSVNPDLTEDRLPGEFPEQPTDGIDEADYAVRYAQWQKMRAIGMTEASYEDYLRDQGVKTVAANNDEFLTRPEVICRNGEMINPANIVEASTGYPATAHVKTLKGRSEHAKYFKEPGFILGVQVWRPKVVMGNVTGSMVGFMDTAEDWMPDSLRDHAYTSVKLFNEATGPGPIQTTGDVTMAVDLRDYLLYGEQRFDFALNTTTDAYTTRSTATLAPALPRVNTADVKYLTETEARSVFLEPTQATCMRMEGIVSLSIASQIGTDETP